MRCNKTEMNYTSRPNLLLIAISIQIIRYLLYSLVTCLLLNTREFTAELQRRKRAKNA